jgi:hypothetical protein
MSPQTAWKRELFYTIGSPIGSLFSLFRKNKKSWHDSVTKTSVFSLEDSKYTTTFYALLAISIVQVLLPIAIGLYIFNTIEANNKAEIQERLEVSNKEEGIRLELIKTRENKVSDYVKELNARYSYPIKMDEKTLWTGTKQSGLEDF